MLKDDVLVTFAATIARRGLNYQDVVVQPIASGCMTYKYEVSGTGGAALIIRFYPPTRGFVIDYEPDLLRRCRDAGIKVPEVILDSRTGPSAPLQYIVYKKLLGQTLSEKWPLNSANININHIVSDIAEMLEVLSSIQMNGWGELKDCTTGSSSSWIEFLSSSFDLGIFEAEQRQILSPATVAALKSTRDYISTLPFLRHPNLIWSDLSPDHIILDEKGRVAGYIDFESALSGDFLTTTGYFYARYHGSFLCNKLFQFWMRSLDEDALARIELYAVLRAVRILQYAGVPLPNGCRREALTHFLPGFMPALQKLQLRIRGQYV